MLTRLLGIMTEVFQSSSQLFPAAQNRGMNVVMYLLNKSIANEFGYITNFIEL
jgi:hypothetical protein